MRLLLSLFTVNMKRAIISVPFLLSACGVTVVMVFATWSLITQKSNESFIDVIYLYGMGTGGGSLFLMTGILPLFPFATTFASEWEQRATSFWTVRTGIRNYAVSKVLASALSGFLTTAVGLNLFFLLMRINLPFFSASSTGDAYATLLDQDMPIRYLLYHVTHISLTSALFAVIALWVSTYLPNKFVTVAAPLVIYFVAHRFTTQLDIPEYLKAITIVEGTYHASTPTMSLLIKLGIVSLLCLFMGFGTVRRIRRRVQHD